jgi:hypothetical protein
MRGALLLALACVVACNDRTEVVEDCYEPNPDPGAMIGSFDLVCGRTWEYRPETPEGLEEEQGPYHVIYCEHAESGAECSRCPTDDVNERITNRLLELMVEAGSRCDPARVDHIIPECVTTPEQVFSSTPQCCFHAWYWGSCNTRG